MRVPDPHGRLRHDLSNPLAAIMAEVEILLMEPDRLTPEILQSLKIIETAALRMRVLLREAAAGEQ